MGQVLSMRKSPSFPRTGGRGHGVIVTYRAKQSLDSKSTTFSRFDSFSPYSNTQSQARGAHNLKDHIPIKSLFVRLAVLNTTENRSKGTGRGGGVFFIPGVPREACNASNLVCTLASRHDLTLSF